MIFVSHAPDAIRAICRRVCVLEQGELAFDGDLEEGLAFYDSILGHAGSGAPVLEARMAAAEERDERAREWLFDFLRSEGLKPGESVVEVGPTVPKSPQLVRFLVGGDYWGSTPDRVHELPHLLDVAIANSLFPVMTFNSVAKTIAVVSRALKPSGRLYATWYENPDPANFDPIAHANGVTTYSDREPFHYSFGLIEQVCGVLGLQVDRLPDSTHPRGESVLVISRHS